MACNGKLAVKRLATVTAVTAVIVMPAQRAGRCPGPLHGQLSQVFPGMVTSFNPMENVRLTPLSLRHQLFLLEGLSSTEA